MNEHEEKDHKNLKVVPLKQWACRPLFEKYEIGRELGRGGYGAVYSATSIIDPDSKFALKKMQNFDEKEKEENRASFGFPITTLRQIKLLQNLSHVNILNIVDVVYERPYRSSGKSPTIYLCLDLMDTDLTALVNQSDYDFTPFRLQRIAKQILQGLEYLHERNIAHRDLKPQNVLINKEGIVKVADFGLAKKLRKISTLNVVSLWYRAPELLLGLKTYSTNIDVWSLGCMLAQFILRRPIFVEARNQLEIMNKIFEICGTPDKCEWTEAQELQFYDKFKPSFSKDSELVLYLKKKVPQMQNQNILLDFIEKMLRINPQSRYSASQCLNHEFLKIELPEEDILPETIVEVMQDKRSKLQAGQQNVQKRVKHH